MSILIILHRLKTGVATDILYLMSKCQKAINYDKLIGDTLGYDVNPKREYTLPEKSCVMTVHDEDFNNFEKLYSVNGSNQGIGYGEIALYWLYQQTLQPGTSSVDLMCGEQRVDVKSYLEGSFITLGKYKASQEIRRILNVLFGCNNLYYEPIEDESASEVNFKNEEARQAVFAMVKFALDVEKMEKSGGEIYESFSNLGARLKEITPTLIRFAKNRGREFIELTEKNALTIADEIVADIAYNLTKYKLVDAPDAIGVGGLIMNVVKQKDGGTNGTIEVHKLVGITQDTHRLHNNFKSRSGEIKVKSGVFCDKTQIINAPHGTETFQVDMFKLMGCEETKKR